MRSYPTHTLAPDPNQLELRLRPREPEPPDRRLCASLPRASPVFTSCCPCCFGVHTSKAEYQACVATRSERH